jgi:hypothetical protein
MKACAIYTGLPRTFKETRQNHINSFLSKYNVKDIYFHFWKENGHTAPWSEGCGMNFLNVDETEIVNVIKPKKYLYENDTTDKPKIKLKYPYEFEKFNKDEIFYNCLSPILSNALSIKRAFSLIKDHYDHYIFVRPDMIFPEENVCFPELDTTKDYFYWNTFWVLKKETAIIFSNKINNIKEYAKIAITETDEGKKFNFFTAEHIDYLHFSHNKINLENFVKLNFPKKLHRGHFIKN